MRLKNIGFLITLSLLLQLATHNLANAAPDFGNSKFKQFWEYSDKLVDEVPDAGRGYTWGPNNFSIRQEIYLEIAGGKRQVQYFDKSRMELSADGTYVTNGLLTKELVTGLRQDGNTLFVQLSPSQTQVAGDDNGDGSNGSAPVYASFKEIVTTRPGQNTALNLIGQVANLSINKAGQVTTLSNPPAQLSIGQYDTILGHNIPQVFLDYQNIQGLTWNGSNFVKDKVYTDNPVANVFGYPISEAYWTKAIVAGQEKDVLVQMFERRVLTYTPSNPDPFKVEMGNIGQHYFKWRYSLSSENLTSTAWNAFKINNYRDAYQIALECVNRFEEEALRLQDGYVKSGKSLPPTGVVDEATKKSIFEQGPVNDVGTAYFIMGQSAEKLNDSEKAAAAYKGAQKFTYARTYDTRGWFWSPAIAATYGTSTSEQLTVAAWKALADKNYYEAYQKAQVCVIKFESEAIRIQEGYSNSGKPLPPVGAVDETTKKAIFAQGVLNDVGASYFIMGQASESLGDKTKAIEAYKGAQKFPYARVWDTQGWFWSPSQAATERLSKIA